MANLYVFTSISACCVNLIINEKSEHVDNNKAEYFSFNGMAACI